jgi:prepilin-type processing-associated H-X9-DG protein
MLTLYPKRLRKIDGVASVTVYNGVRAAYIDGVQLEVQTSYQVSHTMKNEPVDFSTQPTIALKTFQGNPAERGYLFEHALFASHKWPQTGLSNMRNNPGNEHGDAFRRPHNNAANWAAYDGHVSRFTETQVEQVKALPASSPTLIPDSERILGFKW